MLLATRRLRSNDVSEHARLQRCYLQYVLALTLFSELGAQVHRRHVRVFKSLRLRRTQKEDLAALWYAWKRRRHALDQEFSVALSFLSSCVSQQVYWEHPVLAAWGAQPDAAVSACTPPHSSSGHHLSGISLMSAFIDDMRDHRSADGYASEDLEDSLPALPAPSSGPGEVVDGTYNMRVAPSGLRMQVIGGTCSDS